MKVEKVLIVDDSRLARLTLSKLLKDKGIDVVEADGVNNCLKKLALEKFDAVFMDVMMPNIGGFEGVAMIKKDSEISSVPCVIYSGDLSTEAQQKAKDSGASAYLFKPTNPEALQDVIDEIAGNKDKSVETEKALSDNQRVEKRQVVISHQIDLMERRIRNLAKVIMQERKEKESFSRELSEKIAAAIGNSSFSHNEDIERRRIENDLRGQVKTTQRSLKTVAIIAILSAVVSVVTIVITLLK